MIPDVNPMGTANDATHPRTDTSEHFVAAYQALRTNGRLTEAQARVRQFFDDCHRDAEALGAAFSHAMAAGETDLAMQLAAAGMAAYPCDARWPNANGLALAAAGRHEAARHAFEAAIEIDPNLAVGHGNLAQALRVVGEDLKAVTHWTKAMTLCPTDADYPYNLGNALRDAGRWGEAETVYRRCLTIDSRHAGARLNLAKGLADNGDTTSAVSEYRCLLGHYPEMPEALNNLGLLQLDRGHTEIAVDHLIRAAAVRPDRALYRFNLGRALQRAGQTEAAAQAYRDALTIDPAMAMAHANMGALLKSAGRYTAARRHLENARRLEPENVEVLNNLGNLYERLDQFIEAEKAFQSALAKGDKNINVLINYGTLLNAMGKPMKAAAQFRTALEHDPDSADAAFNLAITDLFLGRFEQGWARYDSRFRKTGWADIYPRPRQEFTGKLTPGMRLYVHDEQGLGDTIQFARYLPRVREMGIHVTFETRPPLVPLFDEFPGVDRLVARPDGNSPTPDADAVVGLMSLPGLLLNRVGPHPVPVPFPTARANPRWDARLGTARPRIGLVWAGNPNHDQDHRRSFCIGDLMAVIGHMPATWVSLQQGGAAGQLDFPGSPPVVPLGAELRDFSRTAEVLVHLDLVITADTAVAHLAGSLGRPVWILLPFAPDWRWLRHRSDSPWYLSARLFRQPSPGNWAAVFAAVAQALAAEMSASGAGPDSCEADGLFRRAAAAYSQNRPKEARSALDQCLSVASNHADALNLAAVMAFGDNRLAAAWEWICRACAAAPHQADIAANQGRIAMAMAEPGAAEDAFDRALRLAPDHLDTRIHRAELYRLTGRAPQALRDIEPLMTAHPRHLPLVLLRSRLARAMGDVQTARDWARQAAVLAPADAGVWNQLGIVLADGGDDAEAEAALSRSLAVDPTQSAPRVNQASLRLAQGDVPAALALLNAAVAAAPADPNARFNRAQVLLLTGAWADGWRDYEYRCRRLTWRRSFPNPDRLPIWRGESFVGERLCIMAEQGYGDLVQMIRLAPAVKDRGGEVVVAAAPTLHPVLATAPGVDAVVALDENGRLGMACDRIVPVMSLPGILNLDPDRQAMPSAYLGAPWDAADRWPELAADTRKRVGLVWAGNPDHANDRRRSIPPADLAPILEIPDIQFVSIQTGPPAQLPDQSPLAGRVLDIGTRLSDFGDTAAAMALLDLIITVDTAAAHLAGALGRPVWTLLPWVPDWRWGLKGTKTAWYPGMRLFRQQQRDDWQAPVKAVARSLVCWGGAHPGDGCSRGVDDER